MLLTSWDMRVANACFHNRLELQEKEKDVKTLSGFARWQLKQQQKLEQLERAESLQVRAKEWREWHLRSAYLIHEMRTSIDQCVDPRRASWTRLKLCLKLKLVHLRKFAPAIVEDFIIQGGLVALVSHEATPSLLRVLSTLLMTLTT